MAIKHLVISYAGASIRTRELGREQARKNPAGALMVK